MFGINQDETFSKIPKLCNLSYQDNTFQQLRLGVRCFYHNINTPLAVIIYNSNNEAGYYIIYDYFVEINSIDI